MMLSLSSSSPSPTTSSLVASDHRHHRHSHSHPNHHHHRHHQPQQQTSKQKHHHQQHQQHENAHASHFSPYHRLTSPSSLSASSSASSSSSLSSAASSPTRSFSLSPASPLSSSASQASPPPGSGQIDRSSSSSSSSSSSPPSSSVIRALTDLTVSGTEIRRGDIFGPIPDIYQWLRRKIAKLEENFFSSSASSSSSSSSSTSTNGNANEDCANKQHEHETNETDSCDRCNQTTASFSSSSSSPAIHIEIAMSQAEQTLEIITRPDKQYYFLAIDDFCVAPPGDDTEQKSKNECKLKPRSPRSWLAREIESRFPLAPSKSWINGRETYYCLMCNLFSPYANLVALHMILTCGKQAASNTLSDHHHQQLQRQKSSNGSKENNNNNHHDRSTAIESKCNTNDLNNNNVNHSNSSANYDNNPSRQMLQQKSRLAPKRSFDIMSLLNRKEAKKEEKEEKDEKENNNNNKMGIKNNFHFQNNDDDEEEEEDDDEEKIDVETCEDDEELTKSETNENTDNDNIIKYNSIDNGGETRRINVSSSSLSSFGHTIFGDNQQQFAQPFPPLPTRGKQRSNSKSASLSSANNENTNRKNKLFKSIRSSAKAGTKRTSANALLQHANPYLNAAAAVNSGENVSKQMINNEANNYLLAKEPPQQPRKQVAKVKNEILSPAALAPSHLAASLYSQFGSSLFANTFVANFLRTSGAAAEAAGIGEAVGLGNIANPEYATSNIGMLPEMSDRNTLLFPSPQQSSPQDNGALILSNPKFAFNSTNLFAPNPPPQPAAPTNLPLLTLHPPPPPPPPVSLPPLHFSSSASSLSPSLPSSAASSEQQITRSHEAPNLRTNYDPSGYINCANQNHHPQPQSNSLKLMMGRNHCLSVDAINQSTSPATTSPSSSSPPLSASSGSSPPIRQTSSTRPIKSRSTPGPNKQQQSSSHLSPNNISPQSSSTCTTDSQSRRPQPQPHPLPLPPPPPPPPSNTSSLLSSMYLLSPSLTALSYQASNVCAYCNTAFRMTSDLVYHMRSHHKKSAPQQQSTRASDFYDESNGTIEGGAALYGAGGSVGATSANKKRRAEALRCSICHETFRERHHLTRHMTSHQ